MFDANMCHLPKDHEFFASFSKLPKSSKLSKFIPSNDKLVKCKMLSTGSNNPTVEFKVFKNLKFKTLILTEDETLGGGFNDLFFMKYEGRINGCGFINLECWRSAKKFGFEEFQNEEIPRIYSTLKYRFDLTKLNLLTRDERDVLINYIPECEFSKSTRKNQYYCNIMYIDLILVFDDVIYLSDYFNIHIHNEIVTLQHKI